MKTRTLTVLVTAFLILVAIGGASYYLAPQTPPLTPTPKLTSTPTFTPISTPTSTPKPTPTLTPKPTATQSPTPKPAATPTPKPTVTPTSTLPPTPTIIPSPTPKPVEKHVGCMVYFTPNGQVLDRLIELIDGAQRYVYAAFYDLDLEDIAEALIDAKARGVEVKVVVDSDNMDNPAIRTLLNAGVVVGDRDPDFMHNKFIIIDDEIVWTGSMNPTYNGVYRNDNNVVVVSNLPELVEDFKQEFNELWNGVYGGGTPVPYPEITVNSTFSVEVYFAPEDDVEERIVEELASAKKAVYFATFVFTSKSIANVLIDKHDEGVVVNGIYESFQAGGYSTYSLLEAHGIEVVKDGNPAVMHHKFFVIDNYTVITGSFNPTRHANEANDENVIIIHNRLVAERFAVQFKTMWSEWYTIKPTPTASLKVVIYHVHYDAEGNDNENLNDEYVVIKNLGDTAVDLTGWTLRDEAGHTFTFPQFTLDAGATVTVHTGSGINTETHLYWGKSRAVWNNDHDTAYLYDSQGNLIDKKDW